MFNVRCVLFRFFYAIVKFCVVFVEEIILGATPVKYRCTSTEKTKLLIHPPQVHKKLWRQQLKTRFRPFDFAIWDVLENKTNTTADPNIGLLKHAIEEEWNKMSEEFILKEFESSQSHVDTIILKNGGYIE